MFLSSLPFVFISRSTLSQLLEQSQKAAYQQAINDARNVLIKQSKTAYQNSELAESRIIAESSHEIAKLIDDPIK